LAIVSALRRGQKAPRNALGGETEGVQPRAVTVGLMVTRRAAAVAAFGVTVRNPA